MKKLLTLLLGLTLSLTSCSTDSQIGDPVVERTEHTYKVVPVSSKIITFGIVTTSKPFNQVHLIKGIRYDLDDPNYNLNVNGWIPYPPMNGITTSYYYTFISGDVIDNNDIPKNGEAEFVAYTGDIIQLQIQSWGLEHTYTKIYRDNQLIDEIHIDENDSMPYTYTYNVN